MAENLNISIIIPTCNRNKLLFKCLSSLAKQNYEISKAQIIVINDGQPFSFKQLTKKIKFPNQVKTEYFESKKKGPAAARNIGIKKAIYGIILFLGDDIIANHDLIEKHLRYHKKNPQINKGLLARVTWHPNLEKSTFMDWLEISGMQADYSITNKKNTDFYHFYTTNVSLKKNFLLSKKLLFDEDFIYPIFEDTELGYRLYKNGFELFYLQNIKAYHYHFHELNSYLSKLVLRGKVGKLFLKKHPQLIGKIFPDKLPWKERIRMEFWHLIYPLGILLNSKRILFENYQRLCNLAILSGYNSK